MSRPAWRAPDLALRRSGEAIRASCTARNRRRRIVLGVAGASVLLLVAGGRAPVIIWNVTASAALGPYRISDRAAGGRGDLVAVRLPSTIAAFAVRRRYAGAGVPLIKVIAASDGDRVCAVEDRVFVNGKLAAVRLEHDFASRKLPWWRGCVTLNPTQVLLLNPAPASFDGRYFGPTYRRDILGVVIPIGAF